MSDLPKLRFRGEEEALEISFDFPFEVMQGLKKGNRAADDRRRKKTTTSMWGRREGKEIRDQLRLPEEERAVSPEPRPH